MPLLGRTLSFTVDLSAVECGCNAAVYLVAMKGASRPGTCGGDYYCDANSVCGERCVERTPTPTPIPTPTPTLTLTRTLTLTLTLILTLTRCVEIDLMEANKHALHATAHTPHDNGGSGAGLGGSYHTLTTAEYGPGAATIDTERQFTIRSI